MSLLLFPGVTLRQIPCPQRVTYVIFKQTIITSLGNGRTSSLSNSMMWQSTASSAIRSSCFCSSEDSGKRNPSRTEPSSSQKSVKCSGFSRAIGKPVRKTFIYKKLERSLFYSILWRSDYRTTKSQRQPGFRMPLKIYWI